MTEKSPYRKFVDALRRAYFLRTRGHKLVLNGIAVEVPENAPWDIYKQILRGTYEQAERELIAKYIEADVPVIELGGSIGVVSAFLRSKLAPATPLVVVEANPLIAGQCRKNAGGKDTTTQVINAAIAYGVTEIEFPVSDDYLSNRIGEEALGSVMSVPATNLADLSKGFDRFTLVMDIEGAEYELFGNEAETLGRCSLAIVEIHPHYFPGDPGRSEEAFVTRARQIGFSLSDQRDNVLVLTR